MSKEDTFKLEQEKYEEIRKIKPSYGASSHRLKWIKNPKDEFSILFNKLLKECNYILDIGCGGGDIMSWIIENKKRVVGIDISLENVKWNLKNRYEVGKRMVVMNAADIYYNDDTFDMSYHFDGLEHIPKEYEVDCLKGAVRVSKKYICYSIHTNKSIEDNAMIKRGFPPLHINLKKKQEWIEFFEKYSKELNYKILLKQNKGKNKINFILEKGA